MLIFKLITLLEGCRAPIGILLMAPLAQSSPVPEPILSLNLLNSQSHIAI